MSKEERKKMVPKLRFPEFKESGEWDEQTLDDVAVFLKGKGISKSDVTTKGNLPCIRYGELYTYYKEVIVSTTSSTNLAPDELVLSKANDVIIPSSGETKEDIATASCVTIDGIALGGDLNILRSSINGIFLSYYLTHNKKKSIAKLAQGDAVVHLYSSQLKKLTINFPKSKKEQQKIADCLSSMDELMTAQSSKLESLMSQKKGLMQQLFPAKGKLAPALRFTEFKSSGNWQQKTLESLTSKIGDGIHTTPHYDEEGEYFFINGNNLLDGRIYTDEKSKRVSANEYTKHKKDLNENTILLSINGTIGNVAVYRDEKVVLGKSACYINVSNQLSKVFLYYLLQTDNVRNYFESELTGSTIKNLSLKSIRETIIHLPSLIEQQKIADCLSSLDTLITAQAEKLEALKQHKNGLMQGLFPKKH